MRICLIRHASTSWNEDGRIQGHTDVALSPKGRAQAATWRLPAEFTTVGCVTSPLARARETARLLGFAQPRTDPRLAEMRWGSFEGRTLASLRDEHGQAMGDLEALGVDFQPPGGESPRLVSQRLAACLRDLAELASDQLVVTHKGVLRASLILALGWDMRGKPPVRYDPERALIYELSATGMPTFVASVPLRETGP